MEHQKKWSCAPKKLVVLLEKKLVMEQQSQNQHQRHQHGVLRVLLSVLGAPHPINPTLISQPHPAGLLPQFLGELVAPHFVARP